jgi:uncharacterized damage-inducible protein DinB
MNMKPKGDRVTILDRFKKGPATLENVLQGLSERELDAVPEQGGWTIRQIVHHIADGDDLWKIGIKMALGNEQAEFRLDWYWAFSQDEWTARWAYTRRPLDKSLAFIKACRNHIMELIEYVPNAWDKSVKVPTRDGNIEIITVGAVIEMQADHVMHHVKRIKAILAETKSV